MIVGSETMEFEVISNASKGALHGAGIQAAQTVAKSGAEAVITSNVGPNAFQTLSAAGISIITSAFGTVREAVERYQRGGLEDVQGPTVGGHFGLSRKRGRRGYLSGYLIASYYANLLTKEVQAIVEDNLHGGWLGVVASGR